MFKNSVTTSQKTSQTLNYKYQQVNIVGEKIALYLCIASNTLGAKRRQLY
jgi:hypothetical protein